MKIWHDCGCRRVKTAAPHLMWCPECHGAGGWWVECGWNTIGTTGTSQQEVDELRSIAEHFNKHWGMAG